MKAVEQFITALEDNNIKYDHKAIGEDGIENEYIAIRCVGKNFSGLTMHFLFDEESSMSVNIRCLDICRFSENKNLIMLQTVNSLNYKYRWVSFSVSPEGTVCAEMSAAFTDESAQEILMASLSRIFNIIDIVYPVLMKGAFGK